MMLGVEQRFVPVRLELLLLYPAYHVQGSMMNW